MQGYPLNINIYANNEAEVADARAALIEFIDEHAKAGRAVSATKIAEAVRSWKSNPLVRGKIIDYFK